MLVLSSVLSISSHTLNSEAFLVLLAALFHFFHLRAYQQEVHKICINIFEKWMVLFFNFNNPGQP